MHHRQLSINNASLVAMTNNEVNTGSVTGNNGTHAPAVHQRRRKKRPNYGTRTVEVRRGYNGFGFTISGQQPCRLSCIVADSPADQAGLRNGDFLISINGLNVSKLPHETVVQLIGNSFGSIRMQIAENYYSDSSDEENAALMLQQQQQALATGGNAVHQHHMSLLALGNGGWRGTKPRYLHHRTKMHRLRNSPQKKRNAQQLHNELQQQHRQQRPEALALNAVSACAAAAALEIQSLRPLMEDMPLPFKSNASNTTKNNAPNPGINAQRHNNKLTVSNISADVANVSAMVRVPTSTLEYRAIVGYLGTIEMPKQISHSSKLQTVRSCIRKLRQEKRQPTTVLMTILPDCLRLQSVNGNILASYTSARLNYVSSSSESENRFFGLITSAVHTTQADDKDEESPNNERGAGGVANNDDDEDEEHENALAHKCDAPASSISISNSCHVFVIDTKLCEHQHHLARASEFRIQCTRDPISSLCLEFPNNSEYVVNLIRSMYTMRILPPATRHTTSGVVDEFAGGQAAAAHSPQPSNHSEISTTTSNSDSGIGFHNDCTNISDRILVVDFPGAPELRMRPTAVRPAGIFNNFDPFAANLSHTSNTDKRLTVRAMPDPKTSALARPNLLASLSLIKSPATTLTATRSCDDVLALMERGFDDDSDDDEDNHHAGSALTQQQLLLTHASMDDISLHATVTTSTAATIDDHQVFLQPSSALNGNTAWAQRTPSKLSPQVYSSPIKLSATSNTTTTNNKNITTTPCTPRLSSDFEAFDVSKNRASIPLSFDLDTWNSLQNLNASNTKPSHTLDATNSEPDLGVSQ